MRRRYGAGALLLAACAAPAGAGSFVFADGAAPADVITHPRGYDGTGGELVNTVCFNTAVLPAGVIAADAEAALLKAIATWNRQRASTNNLGTRFGNNDIADDFRHDFESTVLHELGHCIGLGHPNLSSESGLEEPARNATKSRRGANAVFDPGAGADLLHGSADDLRGDDENLVWFDPASNDPLALPGRIDRSTLSRGTADLPAGHTFAANADRSVLHALGYVDTESVMQQGQPTDEVQRRITAEDLRTLRLAMAGLDGVAGTIDDYTLRLHYVGQVQQDDLCDITVRFGASSLGSCAVSGVPLSSNHYRFTKATVLLGSNQNWHFSTAPNTETAIASLQPVTPASGAMLTVGATVTRLADVMAGGPPGSIEVTFGGATCTATLDVASPQSSGSCTLLVAGTGMQLLRVDYLGERGFDASTFETVLGVARPTPVLTITSHAPEPSTTDETYSVGVSVSGGAAAPTPTGTVDVSDGSAGCTIVLAAGSGVCAIEPGSAGARTVVASYGGDANYGAATASVEHTVIAGLRVFRNGFE
jgi:hypothetical protein